MKILALDFETSMLNKGDHAVGNFSADPFAGNYVICGGLADIGTGKELWHRETGDNVEFFSELGKADMIVGFNLAFDLHYTIPLMWRDKLLWDCQTVQYYIERCSKSFPSLDYTLEYYGLPAKDDYLKRALEEGLDTLTCDPELLFKYMQQDVRLTAELFRRQFKEVKKRNLWKFIKHQMHVYKAKVMCESNGMHFEKEKCLAAAVQDQKELADLSGTLVELLSARYPQVPVEYIDLGSNLFIGAVLHGNALTVQVREPVLKDGVPQVYKSGVQAGQVKTRLEKKEITLDALDRHGAYAVKDMLTATGLPRVDKEVLKEYTAAMLSGAATLIVTKLMLYRDIQKNLSTYLRSFPYLVHSDGKIHGQLNTCATATGRKSSSSPNLQNISNKGEME